jgi:Cytochrome C oxidase, cbb3-type, subunit III
MTRTPLFAATAIIISFAATIRILAAQPAGQDRTDVGKQVFKSANCVGCHKWHGNGGGGYGGDALSLRKTELTREQIIETVNCGRPGTGMPFHLRGAYESQPCYGLTRAQISDSMPPEAAGFLRPGEVEAVVDYVIAHVKGKGEPTYDECIAFFGSASRVCGIYKTPPQSAAVPDNSPKN